MAEFNVLLAIDLREIMACLENTAGLRKVATTAYEKGHQVIDERRLW